LQGGEDDEGADPDGFIRQNAFAGDEAGGEATTQWHPNTMRMCKLLRTRIAAAAKEKPHERPPTVAFSQVTRNARRTKAANLFWEVLQLKTWDFIEVDQEHAYDDVQITAAARFHEAIPRA
jgi:cohesin complex subunit SCC1